MTRHASDTYGDSRSPIRAILKKSPKKLTVVMNEMPQAKIRNVSAEELCHMHNDDRPWYSPSLVAVDESRCRCPGVRRSAHKQEHDQKQRLEIEQSRLREGETGRRLNGSEAPFVFVDVTSFSP